jgi:hypothetical protein
MSNVICSTLIAAAAGVLLAACAQPPPLVQALPPGATPAEVIDYAIAQAQYRAAEATGNGDVVTQAENTFWSISQEILSRQDPRLFDAWMVCERYRATGPRDPRNVRSTFEPQFARDCQDTDRRYRLVTSAIRRDLQERIAAADRATVAQAGTGQP